MLFLGPLDTGGKTHKDRSRSRIRRCVAERRLVDAGDDDPLPLDLLLAELLPVPLATVDGAGQHGEELVQEEAAGRGAGPAGGNPEAEPLDPLHEVVGVEQVAEEAVVGDLVMLLDGAVALAPELLLAAQLVAADLAQLLVGEVVAGQPDVEEGDADGELQGRGLGTPGVLGGGAVGGQPAADQGPVHKLEDDGVDPDSGVDGGHGGLDEGEDDSTVGVVDDEEASQNLVLPGQIGNAVLGRECLHVVEQRGEARDLHGNPSDAARDIELAVEGGLPHAVAWGQPLKRPELCVPSQHPSDTDQELSRQ